MTPAHHGQPGTPFLLGVNYWPRRKAMLFWERFDAGEVREEFAMIRDLGLSHVRVFLLWESFAPSPERIDARMIGRLRTVCDLAGDAQLALEPTFFTGHMSGPNWAPDWLLSRRSARPGDRPIVSVHRREPADRALHDIYSERFVLAAEALQLRTVCGALADHPAVWAWSLGNEPDLYCRPRSARAGRKWIARMTAIIRSVDATRPVLIGLHTASLDSDVGLRVDHAAAETDLSVMHGYPMYNPLARWPLDPDWVPYTSAMTAALAGRPVLYEELGLCSHPGPSGWRPVSPASALVGGPREQWFSSEEDGGEYYRQVLPRLVRVGALGAFAWCFADYDPALWSSPPCDHFVHERYFGLFRSDGSLKPAGAAVRDFARSRPLVQAPERRVTLALSPNAYYKDPARHLREGYARFGALGGAGERES